MYKLASLFFLLLFLPLQFLMAGNMVDCRVMTGRTTECNPYSSRLIKAKEVVYDEDKQKLIMTKTLPVPAKKPKAKVPSVTDMIEKHLKVEESLRYKGTQDIVVQTTEEAKQKITEEELRQEEEKKHLIEQRRLAEEIERKQQEAKRLAEEERKRNRGFYTVIKGDTLSTIASKYGMKTKELIAMNQLNKEGKIRIGEKLLLPFPQSIVDAIATGEYKVESDDTLVAIAHKFNLNPYEVAKFNHLQATAIIRVGKAIQLPLPYRLKAKKQAKTVHKKVVKNSKKRKKPYLIRGFGKHKLRVTATAYTSHGSQTDKTPFLAAWNNRIRPGMKIIAVSRDLLSKYKLRNGSKVRIAGLPGIYRVRDKMNKRYRKRIDIYMGLNRRKALRWGRRSVILYW
jgi:LysM repeat protein